MPGGNDAIREVIEVFGAVAIVAIDDDDNVVLVYQYRHAFGRRLWELPAGLLDVDEEPPHLAAARELKEETGLKADTWQVLVDMDTSPGISDESVRVYLATGLSEVEKPAAQDEEADMTVRRYPLAEAVRMVLGGEIVNSIAIAGILAAHAVATDLAQPRPLDSPWTDKSKDFAARKAAQ